MSEHESEQILQVGYLRSCMDRRFVEATRRKFEAVTGLSSDRYYHEALAGGALNQVPTPPPNPNPDGADFQALVNSGTLQNKYPRVKHVFLLAFEDSQHQPQVEIIEPTHAKL